MRVELDPRVDALTHRIIGAAFTVSRGLGHSFLESVYKNAFVEELRVEGLRFAVEQDYAVHYRGTFVGRYVADVVVENTVIVELKAIEMLLRSHHSQLLNYLKASQLPVGLLFNFGKPSVEMKRVLLASSEPPDNHRLPQ